MRSLMANETRKYLTAIDFIAVVTTIRDVVTCIPIWYAFFIVATPVLVGLALCRQKIEVKITCILDLCHSFSLQGSFHNLIK